MQRGLPSQPEVEVHVPLSSISQSYLSKLNILVATIFSLTLRRCEFILVSRSVPLS